MKYSVPVRMQYAVLEDATHCTTVGGAINFKVEERAVMGNQLFVAYVRNLDQACVVVHTPTYT